MAMRGARITRVPLFADVQCSRPTDADLSMLGSAVVTFQCSSRQRPCEKGRAAGTDGEPQRSRDLPHRGKTESGGTYFQVLGTILLMTAHAGEEPRHAQRYPFP